MSTFTQPFFTNRKWIKLWIWPWRDGTLRWEASYAQRSFWIDLLAFAGSSRYPGLVCAGKDGPKGEKTVGYPTAFLAPGWPESEGPLEKTIELFRDRGMIEFEKTVNSSGLELFSITICNWKRYQSDYDANKQYQKTYRDRKKKLGSSLKKVEGDKQPSQLDDRKGTRFKSKELRVKKSHHPKTHHASHEKARSSDDDLKKSYLEKCEDSDGVMAAIVDIVFERAAKSGVKINSEEYLNAAVRNFDTETPGSQDREALMQRMRR